MKYPLACVMACSLPFPLQSLAAEEATDQPVEETGEQTGTTIPVEETVVVAVPVEEVVIEEIPVEETVVEAVPVEATVVDMQPAASTQQSGSRSAYKTWQPVLRARLDLGYNSNVPVLPEDVDPIPGTERESLQVNLRADAGMKWRGASGHRLHGKLSYANSIYTDAEEYNLSRLGLSLGWQHVSKENIYHAMIDSNHYSIDGDAALSANGISGGMAWIHQNRQVTMLSGSLRHLDYDDSEDRSGYLLSTKVAHWFPMSPKSGRRVEPYLQVAYHGADADSETYTSLDFGARLRWRWDRLTMGERIDLFSGLTASSRSYDDRRAGADKTETSFRWQAEVSSTWWYHKRSGLGLSLSYSERSANLDEREYERFRIATHWELKW